ncbi:MAG: hypothetical protein ACI33J_01840 [Clostridium sp.]
MKKKKAMLITTAVLVAQVMSIPVYAAENNVSINEESMYNDYLNICVENDSSQSEYCRFVIRTKEGSLSTNNDNDKKLTYSNFYSSYTTININGADYIYGEGEEIQEPVFDKETKSSISTQKFGDIEITQFLRFVNGFTDKYNDMAEISYEIKNTGKEEANVGIRVMIDAMPGDDDKGTIKVNSSEYEKEFELKNEDVTKEWSVFSNNDNEIEAYGKASSNTEVIPSKIQFANWNNLYDNRWDYSVNYDEANEDSAIAIVWNDVNIESGEKKILSTCYGVRNVDETPKEEENNNKEDSNKEENNKEENNKQEDNKQENNKEENNKGNENLKDVIEQAKENANNAKTSDNNSIYFWLICSVTALALIIGTVLFKNKKKKN